MPGVVPRVERAVDHRIGLRGIGGILTKDCKAGKNACGGLRADLAPWEPHSRSPASAGRDAPSSGALHPVYPEVRKYWIDEILQRGVKMGVDGVDIRIGNHSTYTCEGDMYGFNEPIVEEYKKRYGVDIMTQEYDRKKFQQLNGEYYTLFLRELREALRKHGVPLQVHVNGVFRPGHFRKFRNEVPATFQFDWRSWIEDDIVDSIALKYLPCPKGAGGEATGATSFSWCSMCEFL